MVQVRHQFTLRWHVGGPVAEAELGLQGVEVCLQGPLLLGLGGLGGGSVLAELLQASLGLRQGILLVAVVQPRHRLLDPLEQLQKKKSRSRRDGAIERTDRRGE